MFTSNSPSITVKPVAFIASEKKNIGTTFKTISWDCHSIHVACHYLSIDYLTYIVTQPATASVSKNFPESSLGGTCINSESADFSKEVKSINMSDTKKLSRKETKMCHGKLTK